MSCYFSTFGQRTFGHLAACFQLFYPKMSSTIPQYAHLLPPSWKTQVAEWLHEDTPSFDYGGFVVGEIEREAFLFGKGSQQAVLAGVPFFTEVFEQLGCR